MIELLIVIGIIGVLAAVLLGQFGGATESARATECLTHLRNLGAAVQNFGMTENYYPCAGDVEYMTLGGNNGLQHRYFQHKGFITRYSSSDPYARGGASSHQSLTLVSPYASDSEQMRYCVTNSTIFAYGGRSTRDYVCPSHRKFCSSSKMVDPGWSYVMNSYCGYDWSSGSEATGSPTRSHRFGSVKRPEKRLLFAELQWATVPGLGITPTFASSGDVQLDGVLNYDDGTWDGTKEAIGFNHKSGRNYMAHVCFADGHVEKIMLPAQGGAQQARDLTKWLCDSDDVMYEGGQYVRKHKTSDED